MPTEISNKFTLIDIPYTMLYIHIICISVFPDTDGCTVKGKCYRSQKRNESPHNEKVNIFNLLCHTNLFFAFAASSLHITCIYHSPIHLLYTLILNYKLNKYICYDWVKWRYSLSLFQIVFNDNIIHAPDSNCSCTIGQSGHYGHITALLYQLAYFKQMNLKGVTSDLAKTSMPQTWHLPRGEKMHGSKADQTVVQGNDRDNPHRAARGCTIH